MLNDRSRSILLQVAFKEAVKSVNSQGTYSPEAIAETTETFFSLLESLHEKFGISPDGSSQSSSRSGSRRNTNSRASAVDADLFVYGDASWLDYRPAKANNQVVKNHPDFKTVDGQTAVWMYGKDGSVNEEAAALVEAAGAALV